MYQKLQPLQGHIIPIYYGEVECDGLPAIILEDVKGKLPGQEKPFLPPEEFRRRLEVAYDALRSFGVMVEDFKLANNLLLADKVVLVDLESIWEPDKDDWEFFCQSRIDELVRQYLSFIRSCGGDK